MNKSFQQRVWDWCVSCFNGSMSSRKVAQRSHRFLEEALELVQATGCTVSEAHQLVEYVYNRPVGEAFQEVGGVRVTLALLCTVIDIDEDEAGETELARIMDPAIMEKVRAKQATKPKLRAV